MGANGVCRVIAAFKDEVPIAAAAIVAGPPKHDQDEEMLRRLARIPVYIAYGKNDDTVRAEDCQSLVTRLTQYGADVEVQIYSDPNNEVREAHIRACQNAFAQPFSYQWLLRHKRANVNVRTNNE